MNVTAAAPDSRRRAREGGFSLLELLTIVAIVGMLASLAIPKFLGYMRRSKRGEAELNLTALSKTADTIFAETSSYPQAVAPATPAVPCCDQPGRRCAVNQAEWHGVLAWDLLDFEMTQKFYFNYSYSSVAPTAFQARAVGDLDCDGVTVTYILNGNGASGTPVSTLTRPPRNE
jgi:Tfp pilus assembly protein PilE